MLVILSQPKSGGEAQRNRSALKYFQSVHSGDCDQIAR